MNNDNIPVLKTAGDVETFVKNIKPEEPVKLMIDLGTQLSAEADLLTDK